MLLTANNNKPESDLGNACCPPAPWHIKNLEVGGLQAFVSSGSSDAGANISEDSLGPFSHLFAYG